MPRRTLLLVWPMMALTACSPEASAYKHPLDRLVVGLGLVGWSGYYPCSHLEASDGTEVIARLGSEDCYRFDRPSRMRGIWLVEHETSQLLPGATRSPAVWDIMDPDQTFLEPREWGVLNQLPPRLGPSRAGSANAYAIEFIGRRARYPGVYGMAGARHMVILDRLVSIRAVEPPPPIDWPALIARLRRAEAAREASPPPAPVFRCPFFLCRSPPPSERLGD